MSNKIIFLQGHDVFTKAKQTKIFGNSLEIEKGKYIFVLIVENEISHEDISKLKSLLGAIEMDFSPNLVITPRIGTQSSWSSKAQDIFANIGIDSVARIERLKAFETKDSEIIITKIFDKMTESHFSKLPSQEELFQNLKRKQSKSYNIHKDQDLIFTLNDELGLALNDVEKSYLNSLFAKLDRPVTDAELMMFSQINSEHCRHKIFRSNWKTDIPFSHDSLFDAIKSTTKDEMDHVLSAYHDNSAVIKANGTTLLEINGNNKYKSFKGEVDTTIKVETHNHPTGISPFEGAATGSGGEIRDCSATGRVARPKAGFMGLCLSHLRLGESLEPWEEPELKPDFLASPKDILADAPIGSASYNNEFGRPAIFGYFRTLEYQKQGFHKPIMLAGGVGSIKQVQIEKGKPSAGDAVIVLGGPAMLIGLGGGSASSTKKTSDNSDLDYASVQRSNPEMQRRAQQVLDKFNERSSKNPITFIHDVGAGGISNAIPELAKDTNLGVEINLEKIDSADQTMSPMELWCNESQERYVFTIPMAKVPALDHICKRERCPYSVAGALTNEKIIKIKYHDEEIVNLTIEDLFGEIPLPDLIAQDYDRSTEQEDLPSDDLKKLIFTVLNFPVVGSKKFLITIGDRTVNGLVFRDQLIGNRQMPVSDYAATLDDYNSDSGQVFSIGEKPNIAIENPEASVRMALSEALLNIVGVKHEAMDKITFSANWMSSTKTADERGDLVRGVQAVSNMADALNVSIPVGKDSLSMNVNWKKDNEEHSVTSPMTLNISSFSNVKDLNKSVTPELSEADSTILHLWVHEDKYRMGGSSLYQSFKLFGGPTPDIDDIAAFKSLFDGTQKLLEDELILSMHDISDGGMITALIEMALCSNTGLDINLDYPEKSKIIPKLFSEESGLIIEVNNESLEKVKKYLGGLDINFEEIAKKNSEKTITINSFKENLFTESLDNLFDEWSKVSFEMQKMRDTVEVAEQEKIAHRDYAEFLTPKIDFDIPNSGKRLFSQKPKVALLREQGINGHYDMAAALMEAGFEVDDLHMSEIGKKITNLDNYQGLVVPGGFSYGDVLGAGSGMSSTIIFNKDLKKIFSNFLENDKNFALGICNGCQFMSGLNSIITGAEDWPKFARNDSDQYECRLVQLKIEESKSIFFDGMAGSIIPVMVSHGEGKAVFSDKENNVVARYVDPLHRTTKHYPFNPNGSEEGAAGVCNDDGRIMIMMPHPERTYLAKQYSWSPKEWNHYSPWFKMFDNAYQFTKKN